MHARKILALTLGLLLCGLLSAGTRAEEPSFTMIFETNDFTLDTVAETYTHNMYCDPAITIKLVLSQEDLGRIYAKMQEIDFFHYPQDLNAAIPDVPGAIKLSTRPSTNYHFKAQGAAGTADVTWNNGEMIKVNGHTDPRIDKLEALIALVTQAVNAKDEVKKLPVPRCMSQ